MCRFRRPGLVAGIESLGLLGSPAASVGVSRGLSGLGLLMPAWCQTGSSVWSRNYSCVVFCSISMFRSSDMSSLNLKCDISAELPCLFCMLMGPKFFYYEFGGLVVEKCHDVLYDLEQHVQSEMVIEGYGELISV